MESKSDHPAASVAERLAQYDVSLVPEVDVPEQVDEALVARAAALLTVMPPNQERATIERLLAPHDPDRGRLALDALVAAEFAAEDDAGHIRRVG